MQGQSSKLIAKLDFVDIYYNMLANTFLSKGFENKNFIRIAVKSLEENNLLDVARHPEQVIKFKLNKKVYVYDMMRIKVLDKE